MLPNTDDPPARLPECLTDHEVTRLVRRKFLLPEWTMIGRQGAVLGATVPETTVYKNRDPRFPKDEVWFAEQTLIPTPTDNTVSAKQLRENYFRLLVAATPNP